MMKDKCIDELIDILETTTDERTRRRAAENLGQIGKGKKSAILTPIPPKSPTPNYYPSATTAAESPPTPHPPAQILPTPITIRFLFHLRHLLNSKPQTHQHKGL
ncbi:MAG: hypothetical protein P5702_06275 [Limnospira sp. PMC 1291.21]|uniref:hypothetical protein n=1 Tax=Limnospira TaxID=2596745 RepID=UPI0001E2ADF7|nr:MULTISPECIES: hypothetical protein [Limnospira]MDT9268948.1 hypothetical protein [Limnospira sp. PMC 1234.20]QJB25836.1 hypothetical protein HFV01_08530 [Limnospira fusiformis SAG 85.79]UWU47748.1 hypothetical protein APLC1_2520 [Arthrospira platensis C1]MDT9213612.1 hypothetical protein [Limnospira sp. PMC 1256.20]MDT9304893.1 hypothetical protein [Limnospira sp. PMC 1291.21]